MVDPVEMATRVVLIGVATAWFAGCGAKDGGDAESGRETIADAAATTVQPEASNPAAPGEPVDSADDGIPEGQRAYLTLNSKPWSVVHLDGELLGNTPLKDRAIPAGEHVVSMSCGPCDVRQQHEESFELAPGETYSSVRTTFQN